MLGRAAQFHGIKLIVVGLQSSGVTQIKPPVCPPALPEHLKLIYDVQILVKAGKT